MRPRRPISPSDLGELFDEAVRERAVTVLTVPVNEDWQTVKCRFLERDPNRRFFVLDYQQVEPDRPLPELVPGQCVGVSFRNHSRKILFASVVEARGHFLFDDRSSIPAIRYRWPESIAELQRRSYYRTPVPDTMTLSATLWPGGASARTSSQGKALQVTAGTLADISCGGALVRLNQVSPPSWREGETLGAEIQLNDGKPPMITSVCYRGLRPDDETQFAAAIQFVGLEATVDGRLNLQRLAACVQRFHHISLGSGSRNWNRSGM